MLILLSPAKSLDFETAAKTNVFSEAEFLKESKVLIQDLKKLSVPKIANLMNVSDKIAVLNQERFQNWKTPFTPKNAKQAIFAFTGDVYVGMEANSFSEADLEFAQKHLRILSGLYGLLKPLDLMQAYRLEMGTKFENKKGKNLYEFWGNQITEKINKTLKNQKQNILVNLASQEYFKAVKSKNISAEIITPIFKEYRNGKYKVISFTAKKARGMMARYIIQNKIQKIEKIKNFNESGYQFNEKLSNEKEWIFSLGD